MDTAATNPGPDDPTPGWSALALGRDLPPGIVVGSALRGSELAVWRDDAGRVHVWPDACPHRGMRLSLGFVRDGLLGCAYHGWRFAPDGECRHLPAHPDVDPQPAMAVRPTPALEWRGMVWTSLTPELPAPEQLSGDAAPDAIVPVRSVTIEASCDEVLAALAGSAPLGGQPAAVAVGGDGVELRTSSGALHLAVTPMSSALTGVHLVVDPGLAGQVAALADWLAAVRDSLRDPVPVPVGDTGVGELAVAG